MLSRNGLQVLNGVVYVLGLNLGWVASDALNQVVLSTAFCPSSSLPGLKLCGFPLYAHGLIQTL